MKLTMKEKIYALEALQQIVIRDGAEHAWQWGWANARQRAEAVVYAVINEFNKF